MDSWEVREVREVKDRKKEKRWEERNEWHGLCNIRPAVASFLRYWTSAPLRIVSLLVIHTLYRVSSIPLRSYESDRGG